MSLYFLRLTTIENSLVSSSVKPKRFNFVFAFFNYANHSWSLRLVLRLKFALFRWRCHYVGKGQQWNAKWTPCLRNKVILVEYILRILFSLHLNKATWTAILICYLYLDQPSLCQAINSACRIVLNPTVVDKPRSVKNKNRSVCHPQYHTRLLTNATQSRSVMPQLLRTLVL